MPLEASPTERLYSRQMNNTYTSQLTWSGSTATDAGYDRTCVAFPVAHAPTTLARSAP